MTQQNAIGVGNLTQDSNGNGVFSVGMNATNKVSNNAIIGSDFTKNPWQRNTSFAAPATGAYFADRWQSTYVTSGAGVFTASQQNGAPTGAQALYQTFQCLQALVTTNTAAMAAGDYWEIGQKIEGYITNMLYDKPLVLSFWVYSTKTGTYCVALRSGGLNGSCVFEYTINAASTWEKKTIVFPAVSRNAYTFGASTTTGMWLSFTLASGTTFQTTAGSWQAGNFLGTSNQNNFFANLNDVFRISLVQLEPGSVATPFAALSEQQVMMLCQRYYFKTYTFGVNPGAVATAGALTYRAHVAGISPDGAHLIYPVPMRTTPAVTTYNPTTGAVGTWRNQTGGVDSGAAATVNSGAQGVYISNAQAAGDAVGNNLAVHVVADAEL